ncbi:MAG: hypothetical protein WD941_08360 [Opitutus sp.]
MSDVPRFAVTRHHLSPDLKQAGEEFADVEVAGIAPEKLRTWLVALTKLAPKVEYPVAPELRIVGPHGRFLVQAKSGQVRVTSWSSNAGGLDLTPDRILSLIMGTDALEAATFAFEGHGGSGVARPRGVKISLLIIAILGSNAATAWMLTRPPPRLPTSVLAEFTLAGGEPAGRILADFAGDYETGAAEGDRGLRISPDGTLRWVRYGPNRTIVEETGLTARAAESNSRPVLVADNHGMIELKDAITVVYFGDTYRRKPR